MIVFFDVMKSSCISHINQIHVKKEMTKKGGEDPAFFFFRGKDTAQTLEEINLFVYVFVVPQL